MATTVGYRNPAAVVNVDCLVEVITGGIVSERVRIGETAFRSTEISSPTLPATVRFRIFRKLISLRDVIRSY